MNYKSPEQVELMRHSALLVGEAIAVAAAMIRPGINTLSLDARIEEFILDNGGIPSFKDYHGFPFSACISVNDAVVHGFPNSRELRDGDVISLDVGVFKNNFHGDSAYTFGIGNINEDVQRLLRVTKESLYKGIEKAIAGNRTGDIGYAVQDYTERKNGYGIVRELVGHGLGNSLHEDPQVPNYGKRGSGAKLKDGMVIAIEPMINMGRKEIYHDADGWTIRTKDAKPAAHYEHTLCVRKDRADILSSFENIEAAEQANEELCSTYFLVESNV